MRVGSEAARLQPQLEHQVHENIEPATTTGRRRGDGGERVTVTEGNLLSMKNVVILQNEGIIYCPIAKVSACYGELALGACCRASPVDSPQHFISEQCKKCDFFLARWAQAE